MFVNCLLPRLLIPPSISAFRPCVIDLTSVADYDVPGVTDYNGSLLIWIRIRLMHMRTSPRELLLTTIDFGASILDTHRGEPPLCPPFLMYKLLNRFTLSFSTSLALGAGLSRHAGAFVLI